MTLSSDRGDLAVFFLRLLHQIGDVDKELAVEMRPAGAIEAEKIVSRSGGGLGGGACGNILHGYVVDRDGDIVLLAPRLRELVEPDIVVRDEMGPLHDRERFVGGQAPRNEWRGKDRCRAGGGEREACRFQEPASRDGSRAAFAHLGLLFSRSTELCAFVLRSLPYAAIAPFR